MEDRFAFYVKHMSRFLLIPRRAIEFAKYFVGHLQPQQAPK